MPSPLGVSLCCKGRESPVNYRARLHLDGLVLTVMFAKAPFLSRIEGRLGKRASLNGVSESCRDSEEPLYPHLVASGPGEPVVGRDLSHCGNSHRKGRLWT